MHVGLRTKFLLLTSVLLLIIFGTITVFQINSKTNSLRANLFEESRAFASLATQPIGNVFGIYKDSGTFNIDREVDKFAKLNKNITNITIVDVSGKTVFSQNSTKHLNVTSSDAGTFETLYKNNNKGALETIIFPYFEGSGAHRFTLVYTVSDQEIEQAVKSEAIQLLYFGIVSLVVTMVLVYLLINKFIIKPIRLVSEQASVISAGNLEQQIEVHGRDEIASLGQSVNKMAESLIANIAELKEVDKVKSEFMMITSHNLRTPLTIISGYLENMELVMNNPEKLLSALKRIGSSVKRLEVFAEDVLTISRFELGDAQIQAESVKISDIINRIASDFAPTAEIKQIKFETEIHNGDDLVSISVPYIRSAVWNVLDNAAKFTKEGGMITLKLQINAGFAEIITSDTGIGISKSELPKLFTKFHRGTSTLTYDFEGTGIGLYASKVMVEKQGGTIVASSEEGKGSTFTIRLPLAPSNSA